MGLVPFIQNPCARLASRTPKSYGIFCSPCSLVPPPGARCPVQRPPRGSPLWGRPVSPPSTPQGLCSRWFCPPTACSFPARLPRCPLGPSAADTPVSSQHLDHAKYTVPSGNQKGDPVTAVPTRDSSARALRESPHPSRGEQEGQGLTPG